MKIGEKLGPYEISELIGRGGMGEVYRAYDSRLHRDVAIKLSTEQFNERFLKEARAVAALNHPNVCTLYDVGPNYLVMELVEGPTLSERIDDGAVPMEEALTIAHQIAEGLSAAHEKGIVHRDLKPGNVKLRPDGVVKVLDFGLAKMADSGAHAATSEHSPTITIEAATRLGVIMGTAGYMSPEQARGKNVDRRCDTWAFGVVLYEMLSGDRLFLGETLSDTLAAVLTREPDYQHVPAKVHRLLKSCLEKDPNKRLREVTDAWILLDDAPPAPVAVAIIEPGPRSSFQWAAWALSALLLFGLAALAWVHFRETRPTAELVRFQITAPPKTELGDFAAVSPDGRRLVFTATTNGVDLLWLRALDTLEARPLEGTENGIGPFWSPDSRFIAFIQAGKLKKMDAAGGPAELICDVASGYSSGAWSKEGTIVLGGPAGNLVKVPITGGALTPVTGKSEGKDAYHDEFPVFLPDGKRFVYLRHGTPDASGVFVASLDAAPDRQSTKRVVATGFSPSYAPSTQAVAGQLLFMRGEMLVSQEFDSSTLELKGDAKPVAPVFAIGQGRASFSVSVTGAMVYRSGSTAVTTLSWFDRDGRPGTTFGASYAYGEIALSPDGSRLIAFRRDGQGEDLWLTELNRPGNSRLTMNPANESYPVWSPDGSEVIFGSNRNGAFDFYRKPSNGGGEEKPLLITKERKFPLDWSRDGKYFLYVLDSGGVTRTDLYTLSMDPGAKPQTFLASEFQENQGRFSPDSRWIAYRSDVSGRNEIYVRPFPASAGGSGMTLVSSSGGSQSRWRKDGKELIFLAPDGTLMSVDVTLEPSFKAGIPKPLFRPPVYPINDPGAWGWDMTPDGKRFLINTLPPENVHQPLTVLLNWQAALRK